MCCRPALPERGRALPGLDGQDARPHTSPYASRPHTNRIFSIPLGGLAIYLG